MKEASLPASAPACLLCTTSFFSTSIFILGDSLVISVKLVEEQRGRPGLSYCSLACWDEPALLSRCCVCWQNLPILWGNLVTLQ